MKRKGAGTITTMTPTACSYDNTIKTKCDNNNNSNHTTSTCTANGGQQQQE
jgi:hypothetical protein